MNRLIKQVFGTSTRLFFLVLILFAVATFFFGQYTLELSAIELGAAVLLYVYSRIAGRRRGKEMVQYIESVTSNIDSATKNTLTNFPLPMAIFTLNQNELIYANESFLAIAGEKEHSFSFSVNDILPGFSTRWLMEGKNEYPGLVSLGGMRFRVFGSLIRGSEAPGVKNYVATTYWVDETAYAELSDEFEHTRMVFSTIMLDNYDEILNGLAEKDKSQLIAAIDEIIVNWAAKYSGYLTRSDRDRYIYICESRYLDEIIASKFELLDLVRALISPKGMHPTLSIGIGKDGKDIGENCHFSALALEMSLSRGGDQAVIKNKYTFEFFGGKTSQAEKRTKVKSRVMASSLSELMRDATKVFIMGHKHSDLDAVGSAIGLCCAARVMGKKPKVVVDYQSSMAKELIDKVKTLPEYQDVFINPQDAILAVDGGSLLIVVDTNRPEQVESENLLLSVNRVAVIDHHRRAATYIQNAALSLHEPYASSACELVTELLQYMVEQSDILRYEAEALMSGIVLDTKNFTLRTGGRTFDAAAFLRRAGADTRHEINIRLFSSLIPDAKRTGVKILLENMFVSWKAKRIEAICADMGEACAYIDELNAIAGEEIFGFCYDSGHAALLGKNQEKAIRTLGHRLLALHLHDNDGVSDSHRFPYYGITDWETVLRALHEIGYSGTLNFETFNEMDSHDPALIPKLLE
ncbi:MAG: DHH family phosphoesterase, partial [Oscillospiraceae bacterium]|nr:DHH family phosphoesterase [Oscillospiraceae bacterium]